MPIVALRYEHWLGPVQPLSGPAGRLWLRPWGAPRRIGLDPATGRRVVDEQATLEPPEVPAGAGLELTDLPHPAGDRITHVLVQLPEARGPIEVAVQSVRGAGAILSETHLAIFEHCDIVWIERAALAAARASRVELTIEDVATDPPPRGEVATVDYIGAATGMGFLQTERFGRVRFDGRGAGLKKGDRVHVALGPDGKVKRWWLPTAVRQALPPEVRCLRPASWPAVEHGHAIAAQQQKAAEAEARARRAELEAHYAASVAGRARELAKAAAKQRALATHRTSVVYPVEIETRDGERLDDEDALQELDGLEEASGDLLRVLTDDEQYDGVWLRGVLPVLRFDGETEELTFNIEFHAEEAADRDANVYLAKVADRLMAEHYADGLTFRFGTPHSGATAKARPPWREIESIALSQGPLTRRDLPP